jgi:hypothetical protein
MAATAVRLAEDILPTAVGGGIGMFVGYYISRFQYGWFQSDSGKSQLAPMIVMPILVSTNIAIAMAVIPRNWAFGYVLTSSVLPVVAWSGEYAQISPSGGMPY